MSASHLSPVSQRGLPLSTSVPCKHPKAIVAIAIGVIISLGAVFLLLAAFSLLPHGVNAVSQLGIGGKVAGGILLAVGLLSTGYGLFCLCRGDKTSPDINEKPNLEEETEKNTIKSGAPLTQEHIADFLKFRSAESQKYGCARETTFFYPKCDGIDDAGWGCAWRSIQTCASAVGYFPTFQELYSTYRRDPEAKTEWAEPGYAKRYFDAIGFPSSTLVLYKRAQGTAKTPTQLCQAVSDFARLREMMLQHFETHATPIMADDEMYAFAIVGIRVTSANETILLIADPHKFNPESSLYYVVLDGEGRQIATTGVDDRKNGISSVGRLHFDRGWMFFFPKKNSV